MTSTIKIKNSKEPYDFIVIDEEKFDPQIHERFFSFDEINADLRPEYRKIIEYVLDHYLSTDEWILEQVLFHPNGPLAKSGLKQSDLQNLSGLLYQFDDSGKSKYQVTFPAVFFTDRGNEYEGKIYAYIRHLQERYQKDPYIESVSSENLVSGNIISESWAHKLGRLIQLSGFLYGGSFSIGSEGWSAGFPSKLVIESSEHTDLKEYIRSLVMNRYDPSSPVFEGDRWTKKEQHNKVFHGESISQKELSPNSKAIGIKSSYNSESNSKDKKMPDPRKVFVVHGRDSRLRDDFFSFLRALGLQPIEWSEALKLTGKATPYTGEAIESAFKNAQAVIVLLSPDDEVRLSPELWKDKEDENEKEIRIQARPNVLFEAGMAFGTHHDRTLLVEVGQVKAFSDVAGRHVVRLSNSSDRRNEIAERLRTAGCDVSTSGDDWLTTGNFSVIREKKNDSIGYTQKDLTEGDIIALLDDWWPKSEGMVPDNVKVNFSEIDTSLGLPPGSSKKYIDKVAKRKSFKCISSGNVFAVYEYDIDAETFFGTYSE